MTPIKYNKKKNNRSLLNTFWKEFHRDFSFIKIEQKRSLFLIRNYFQSMSPYITLRYANRFSTLLLTLGKFLSINVSANMYSLQ